MSRREDVIRQYLMRDDVAEACKLSNTFTIVYNALDFAFDQGERFGKQVKYAEKVEAECLIQPENDRVWREQLEAIQKDKVTPDSQLTVKLLGLIAEMILYRKNGG